MPMATGRPMTPDEEDAARAIIEDRAARAQGIPAGAGGAGGVPGTMGAGGGPSGERELLDQARAQMGVGAGGAPQAVPAGGGLAGDEAAALTRAREQLGKKSLTEQTPEQAAAAAQAALAAGQPRVIGMTRAGFQPSTRTSQQQREHTEMPPGYLDVASSELRANQAEGEAVNEQALLAAATARKNAMVRGKIGEIQQFAEQKAADEEDRALKNAQDQITSAIAEFHAGGPKDITYRDIWKSQDLGGKVTMALGFIAGVLGSVGKGNQNEFVKRLDSSIQRKIDLQELESQRQAKSIGFAQNAYEVLHQRFRDRDTTRKMLHLIALQQFDQHVAEQMANLGLSSPEAMARAAELRGNLANKQRGIMKELSSKILEQGATTEKYAPATAIVAPGGDGVGKKAGEEANKYELERMKAGMPGMANAINEFREVAKSMGPEDQGFFEDWARRRANTDPGSWSEFILRNKNPQLTQRLISAANNYVQSKGGKQLTESEAARFVAGVIGKGDKAAIEAGTNQMQREYDKLEETLHSAFPEGYRVGNLRRGVYRNVDQPHEIVGEEKAPDLNKRVISP